MHHLQVHGVYQSDPSVYSVAMLYLHAHAEGVMLINNVQGKTFILSTYPYVQVLQRKRC